MLLAPKSTDYPYYAAVRLGRAARSKIAVPDDPDAYGRRTGGGTLSPGHPVTLDLGQWPGPGLHPHASRSTTSTCSPSPTASPTRAAQAATLYPYAYVARDGVPKDASTTGCCMRALSASPTAAKSTPTTTTSRTTARRPRPSPPPAAGSASPTNTGWRPSSRRRTRPSTAPICGARPSTPAIKAYQANYRLGARNIAPGASASGHPPPVRRRQGGRHAARL